MKVITGEVRFSYLNAFTPKLNTLNDKMEYTTQILIPKSDKATVKKINEAVAEAEQKKWNGKPPVNRKHPLRDGDTETKDDGSPLPAEYHGHYFMTIKSDQKPGIVDRNREPVLDSTEFVSGDFGRVSMNSYGYDHKGNKGVAFGWNNAQFLRKGESLGGRTRAEDDFEAVEGEDFLD